MLGYIFVATKKLYFKYLSYKTIRFKRTNLIAPKSESRLIVIKVKIKNLKEISIRPPLNNFIK